MSGAVGNFPPLKGDTTGAVVDAGTKGATATSFLIGTATITDSPCGSC